MERSLFPDVSEEAVVIEPKQIIGTKWDSWCDSYKGLVSVEFIDKSYCIYTSEPKKYPITYTIEEGKLFISNIEGPFELRGDVLFNNDLPVFEKAA